MARNPTKLNKGQFFQEAFTANQNGSRFDDIWLDSFKIDIYSYYAVSADFLIARISAWQKN